MPANVDEPSTPASRSELARQAHQLGIQHIEHLRIEELIEAITETREYTAESDPVPEQIRPGGRST